MAVTKTGSAEKKIPACSIGMFGISAKCGDGSLSGSGHLKEKTGISISLYDRSALPARKCCKFDYVFSEQFGSIPYHCNYCTISANADFLLYHWYGSAVFGGAWHPVLLPVCAA